MNFTIEAGRTPSGVAKFRIWPEAPSLTPLTVWISWQEAHRYLGARGSAIPKISEALEAAIAVYDDEVR